MPHRILFSLTYFFTLILAIIPHAVSGQSFTDVAPAAGAADAGPGRGIAWGDADQDGDLDLYLANSGQSDRLFRNSGSTLDADIGLAAGLGDNAGGFGVAWGDYDNDGDLDLYLARSGRNNALYRNNGDGTFTDVAIAAGVADNDEGRSVAWGDYDNDGDLDLYLANDGPNRLYRNDGDGRFTEVGAAAGVGDSGISQAAAWGDYDNDGDLDLYVSNGRGGIGLGGAPNRLYRNNGDGSFTNVAGAARVDDDNDGRGAVWGDYDNDGDLDLYLANSDEAAFVSSAPNRLYQNNGAGVFTDIAGAVNVNDNGDSRSAAWADYDNDGFLDLYLVSENANRLYHNDGAGGFTEVGDQLDVDDGGFGVSASWGDLNNDGWLDLYVVNDRQANRLYRNNLSGNRWLTVRLVGSESNRDGIGAQIIAAVGTSRQRRDVDGGSGYLSQPSLPVEFGFGSQTTVDSLIILWPSGHRQVFRDTPTNQHLTAFEADAPTDLSGPIIALSTDIHRVNEQESYAVEATVSDQSVIQKVLLLYRLSGQPDWTDSLTMTAELNSRYATEIPSGVVNRQGVVFSVRARDQFGNTTDTPVQGLSVAFTDFQSDGFSLPSSDIATAADFRMISLPAVVGNRNPVAILGPSLNPDRPNVYDKAVWRLLRWDGSQNREYPSAGDFDPGKAFWLIARDPAVIELPSAVTASDVQRTVTLTPGWNQIGTPYLFPTPVSAVLDSNQSGVIEPVFWFWNGADYEQATTLKPWHGYWVRNLASSNIELVIPRIDADIVTPKRISKRLEPNSEHSWSLQIAASSGDMHDRFNFAGVSGQSSEGWDVNDISEPPAIGSGAVSLAFDHQDWSRYPGHYAGDIREAGRSGYTWHFEVKTDQAGPTIVEIMGIERLPGHMQAILVDPETNHATDLRKRHIISFITGKEPETRMFTLLVGASSYIAAAREATIPATVSLQQNTPNPFNPSTTIAFTLPTVAQVRLRVLNILGQEVRVLADKTLSAGRHAVRWDGTNAVERPVASGVYFYQLEVGSEVRTRKMILLR